MPVQADKSATAGLGAELKALRLSGQVEAARELLARRLAERHDPRLAFLSWQHEPFWWQPLRGRRVTLRRRGPEDVALVRRCWRDRDFMRRFNQQAATLPDDDAALCALLQREHWALPEDSRALHWTVVAPSGEGCGFVSLVEISFRHRRSEFLIGVLPGTAPGVAAEAAHVGLAFAATRVRLERLYAHFYADNPYALRNAEKLGFEREGVLRGHLSDPATGARADLLVAGLLLDEAFFARSARLRRRLLGDVGAGS